MQFWQGQPTIQHYETAARCTIAAGEKNAGNVINIAVLSITEMPKFDDVQRKRAMELMRATNKFVRINVQVIEGEGFVASFVRGVVAGMNMLSPAKSKVF